MSSLSLFSSSRDFKNDVFRNIVSLRKSEDLFDDINDNNKILSALAVALEANVKKNIPLGLIQRGFHYTTAIAYPFETDPFLKTRYGDGSYGVWYGSLSLETSIYETTYHMLKHESDVEGLIEPIVRERAVYKIYCQAILIDLTEQVDKYPELISNEYQFTQPIGQRLQKEGHPGLLAPSARHYQGINTVIFNPDILNNPRHYCYLTYTFYPLEGKIVVERSPKNVILTVHKRDFSKPIKKDEVQTSNS